MADFFGRGFNSRRLHQSSLPFLTRFQQLSNPWQFSWGFRANIRSSPLFPLTWITSANGSSYTCHMAIKEPRVGTISEEGALCNRPAELQTIHILPKAVYTS